MDETPTFSIVIATYARPQHLANCLAALAALDYPRHRFDVVVVDDGSPVPLTATVAPFRDRLDLTLLSQPRGGPAAARNAGAARATGTYLAFTDDDCAPAPDWLRALAARFAATPMGMVGGRTINALERNPFSTASQLLVDYLYSYYNADPAAARFFTSNNLALPTDRFCAIGGFDTRYTRAAAEDRGLCDRWRHLGHRLTYAPEAVVLHRHRLGPRSFWRQHFGYGLGAFAFHRSRAARGLPWFGIEPVSFYVRLLRFPWRRSRGVRALGLTLLLIVAQLANAAGFVAGFVRRRETPRPASPGPTPSEGGP